MEQSNNILDNLISSVQNMTTEEYNNFYEESL